MDIEELPSKITIIIKSVIYSLARTLLKKERDIIWNRSLRQTHYFLIPEKNYYSNGKKGLEKGY